MKKTVAFCIIWLLAGAFAFAGPSLLVEDEYPTVGEFTMLSIVAVLDNAPYEVSVTYRPNSETVTTKTIGALDDEGRIEWKPEFAGLADLSIKEGSGNKVASKFVSVKYPSAPISGIAIMLLAGTLLFGGAALSLKKALSL